MDNLKQKLTTLRNEESDLLNKQSELDDQIRDARSINDRLQYKIQELVSSEKLMKLKLDSENARLVKIEASIFAHTRVLTKNEASERDTNLDEVQSEDIQIQLNNKRDELNKIEARYNEVVIHEQHLQADKRRKEERAAAVEANLKKLEEEHSDLRNAFSKVELRDSPITASKLEQEDMTEEIEEQLRQLQHKLDVVNNAYEASQREIARLDRLIAGSQASLDEQRRVNESLKKEFDGLCAEMDSI